MLRARVVCFTIVAALPLRIAAAAPAFEDLPVPAAAAAAARSMGLEPTREPARFLSEFIRLLYTPPAGKNPAVDLLLAPQAPPAAPGDGALRVPVPLTARIWSDAVFHRTVRADQLVGAIAADRRAALLCYTLTALDDDTLMYLMREPGVLTRLYERGAAAFAAFGASLRIRSDRVIPPGGDAAVPLWEAVVGQSVTAPDRFIRALFADNAGRTAYVYDTIAQLDPPVRSFALGLWIDGDALRVERLKALVATTLATYTDWPLDLIPFFKPPHDLSLMLMRMRVEPSGVPAPPNAVAFWTDAFRTSDLTGSVLPPSGSSAGLVDAAWILEAATPDLFRRGERFDQIAFAQRLFGRTLPAGLSDALVAVRAFPRQRMLMLALERAGITDPVIYALAARRAEQLVGGDSTRAFWRLAQFESALAMVTRMTVAGTLTPSAAGQLITSLCDVPVDESDRYLGGIARWLEADLLPRMPTGEGPEDRVIAGLAGPSPGTAAPVVMWEGQRYRVDPSAGERQRIQQVRQHQGGFSLDASLDVSRAAGVLLAGAPTADQIRQALSVLTRVGDAMALTAGSRRSIVAAPGVQPPRDSHRVVVDAIEELTRAANSRDARRAARAGGPLVELGDILLGSSLLSIVYAVDLGDPDGAALMGSNVALRHDFGFTRIDNESRLRTVWSVPRQDFQPGVPWHVTGSVLGLDIALASLALRRESIDRAADVPHLPSNERQAFALNTVLVNPARLRDADVDGMAAAIGRGRQRVLGLATRPETLDAVADAVQLDGWRRRAVAWMIAHDPEAIPSMFSLVELMMLGQSGPLEADVDAWGGSALDIETCACTRTIAPSRWRLLSGRPQLGVLAAALPDLNLSLAMELHEMKLPAALVRPVLALAVQQFIDVVAPTDPNDFLTLVRTARSLDRERIEDYVAAAAAVNGPLVLDVPNTEP